MSSSHPTAGSDPSANPSPQTPKRPRGGSGSDSQSCGSHEAGKDHRVASASQRQKEQHHHQQQHQQSRECGGGLSLLGSNSNSNLGGRRRSSSSFSSRRRGLDIATSAAPAIAAPGVEQGFFPGIAPQHVPLIRQQPVPLFPRVSLADISPFSPIGPHHHRPIKTGRGGPHQRGGHRRSDRSSSLSGGSPPSAGASPLKGGSPLMGGSPPSAGASPLMGGSPFMGGSPTAGFGSALGAASLLLGSRPPTMLPARASSLSNLSDCYTNCNSSNTPPSAPHFQRRLQFGGRRSHDLDPARTVLGSFRTERVSGAGGMRGGQGGEESEVPLAIAGLRLSSPVMPTDVTGGEWRQLGVTAIGRPPDAVIRPGSSGIPQAWKPGQGYQYPSDARPPDISAPDIHHQAHYRDAPSSAPPSRIESHASAGAAIPLNTAQHAPPDHPPLPSVATAVFQASEPAPPPGGVSEPDLIDQLLRCLDQEAAGDCAEGRGMSALAQQPALSCGAHQRKQQQARLLGAGRHVIDGGTASCAADSAGAVQPGCDSGAVSGAHHPSFASAGGLLGGLACLAPLPALSAGAGAGAGVHHGAAPALSGLPLLMTPAEEEMPLVTPGGAPLALLEGSPFATSRGSPFAMPPGWSPTETISGRGDDWLLMMCQMTTPTTQAAAEAETTAMSFLPPQPPATITAAFHPPQPRPSPADAPAVALRTLSSVQQPLPVLQQQQWQMPPHTNGDHQQHHGQHYHHQEGQQGHCRSDEPQIPTWLEQHQQLRQQEDHGGLIPLIAAASQQLHGSLIPPIAAASQQLHAMMAQQQSEDGGGHTSVAAAIVAAAAAAAARAQGDGGGGGRGPAGQPQPHKVVLDLS